jgi:hypothetical protein
VGSDETLCGAPSDAAVDANPHVCEKQNSNTGERLDRSSHCARLVAQIFLHFRLCHVSCGFPLSCEVYKPCRAIRVSSKNPILRTNKLETCEFVELAEIIDLRKQIIYVSNHVGQRCQYSFQNIERLGVQSRPAVARSDQ